VLGISPPLRIPPYWNSAWAAEVRTGSSGDQGKSYENIDELPGSPRKILVWSHQKMTHGIAGTTLSLCLELLLFCVVQVIQFCKKKHKVTICHQDRLLFFCRDEVPAFLIPISTQEKPFAWPAGAFRPKRKGCTRHNQQGRWCSRSLSKGGWEFQAGDCGDSPLIITCPNRDFHDCRY